MTILLKNIVPETYTNASGFSLFTVLKDYIISDQPITLSFKGSTPPSSSFLNSSFGELLDNIGFDKFRQMIRLSDLTQTQAQALKFYFNSCGIEI